jgi:hypothetical protein
MAGVLALLGLLLVLLLGTPTFRAELTPEGLSLSAEAQSQGLSLKAGGLWNAQGFFPQLSASWTPQVRTCTITFTTDSLSCILVKPGQELREGDLIGYARAEARDRIAWLEARLPEVEDEALRAEVLAEIQRLRKENEVRALIPGKVLAVEVEQVRQGLSVRIQVLSEKP